MKSRLGPLVPLDGALGVGDVTARHLQLTPAGLAFYQGENRQEEFTWENIAAVKAAAPFTYWPHPRLGDTLGSILWGYPMIEEFPVRITLADGTEIDEEIDGHHIRGYRRAHTRILDRLIEHLMSSPASRALLTSPEAVLARISGKGSDWGW